MEDNIDAALVCEDRLREYTWTINEEQAQVVDAVLVFQICGSFEVWPQGTREPSTGNVKDNLDVTLVYGKRDLEATKIVVSFLFLSKWL